MKSFEPWLYPILSPDELRVYVAAVLLHDAGEHVTAAAIQGRLGDLTFSQIDAALAELADYELIVTTHTPKARLLLESSAVSRWKRERLAVVGEYVNGGKVVAADAPEF